MDNHVQEGKTTAIVAYITIIGSIIAIFMNLDPKNSFSRFHIRQAFGVNITFYLLAYIVGNFDSLAISAAFYIFIVVLWTYGFTGALQGKKTEVPLLGNYFQKWFTFIS